MSGDGFNPWGSGPTPAGLRPDEMERMLADLRGVLNNKDRKIADLVYQLEVERVRSHAAHALLLAIKRTAPEAFAAAQNQKTLAEIGRAVTSVFNKSDDDDNG